MNEIVATIPQIVRTLERKLEAEQERRNFLAEKMTHNQTLKTPEERHADGFSTIYSDLESSKYKVAKLQDAILALRHFVL